MVNLLYVSAIIAAVAFFILVIYLCKTLKSLSVTLNSVSTTLVGLEKQMDGVTKETAELLHKTNALAEDIGDKSEKLNVVVDAIQGVGVTVQQFNGTLRKITHTIDHSVDQNQEKISQFVQWGQVFLEMKDSWKKRKNVQ